MNSNAAPIQMSWSPIRKHGIVLIVPLLFVAVQWYLRETAGPFWQWNLLDPSYFYLLDALNLLNGRAPGHIAHPGITVDVFNAALIWLSTLFDGRDMTEAALAEPERYLRMFSNGVIVLNASALVLVGVAGRRVFGGWVPVIGCQMAPFMSTIILKHAFLPKPEGMLVFATSLFIALTILSVKERGPGQGRDLLAIAFGIVAGLVLTTKITAAPVLVLPLFVLRDPRAIILYGVSSVAAVAVFFLPALGALPQFIDWIVSVGMASGKYGMGSQTVIDLNTYPGAFVKILKRPSLKVPLILAVISLSVYFYHPRSAWRRNATEAWVVFGVSIAQLAQTALVAKQQTAFYMIPSYMLAAVSVLFSLRVLWSSLPVARRMPVSGSVLAAVVLGGFAVAQAAGVERLNRHFQGVRAQATPVDDRAFARCAKIFIYSTSSPVFALYLANEVTGRRFSPYLKPRFPADTYWIDDWIQWKTPKLKNWDGDQDFDAVRAAYPCVYFRGNRPGGIERFLKIYAPDARPDMACRAGAEQIATLSTSCRGAEN